MNFSNGKSLLLIFILSACQGQVTSSYGSLTGVTPAPRNVTVSNAVGNSTTNSATNFTTNPTMKTIPSKWKTSVDVGVGQLQNADLFSSAEIGYVYQGADEIWDYGSTQKNSIFEIGSVTKTFTGIMLAEEVLEGKVALDGTVDEYLPEFKGSFVGGITLRELATHTSGLARMPCTDPNLSFCWHPADFLNPYVDYHWTQLEAYLLQYAPAGYDSSKPRLPYPRDYSNTGFALLGALITKVDGAASFEAMLIKRITGPLLLTDTKITLDAEQTARLVKGHDVTNQVTPNWDFDVMAPTGAIRSTATDMMNYVRANLDPENLAANPATKNLGLAMTFSQQNGLGWDSLPGAKVVFKDGETGGYAALMIFEKSTELGNFMIANLHLSPDESHILNSPFSAQTVQGPGLPIAVPALQSFTGHYQCPQIDVRVNLVGNYLSLESNMFSLSTARATSALDFELIDGFDNDGMNSVSFVENATGLPSAVTLHLKDENGNPLADQTCSKQ